ncbi:MAG: hypothetical protein U0132_16935 [Gemmatimonadaceae bacterium]
MVWLDPVVLTSIIALPVSATAFAVGHAMRAARRNRQERCGNCNGPLYASGAMAGPSLVQGHLVCEPCAANERRTLSGSLVAAGAITGAAVLGLAAVAVWAPAELGTHPWVPVVATVLTYPAIFGGAVAWMKRLNRRAAERLGLQPGASNAVLPSSPPALPAGSLAPGSREGPDA